MAFITVTELNTHLYGELVDEITREDATIAASAISAAVSEAKSYLGDYDAAAIFSATGAARNDLILYVVKDIAAWHLVSLANPNIELQLREKRYDEAVRILKEIQRGNMTPDLPLKPDSGEEPGQSGSGRIRWGSNPKRNQHF